jgi:tetratricopeptide (TPR) repeat protein
MKLLSILLLLLSCAQVKKTPQDQKFDQFYALAKEALEKENYQKALKYLFKAKEILPNRTEAYHKLGIIYLLQGDSFKAIDNFKKVLELDPSYDLARGNLGNLYYQMGKKKLALEYYQRFIENPQYAKDYNAHLNLADIFYNEDNLLMAKKHLLKAISSNKKSCTIFTRLGKVEMDLKNNLAALKYFSQSVEDPCFINPESLYLRGLILEKLGHYKKARESYWEVTEKFPTTFFSSFAHSRLGNIRTKKDKKL